MVVSDMHVPKIAIYSVIATWSACVLGGYLWVTNYGFRTEQPASGFRHEGWPSESQISLAAGRPTLLLFLHPRCPCTRATLRELEKIISGRLLTRERIPRFIAVAPLPFGAAEDWRNTDTIQSALSLPNSSVVWDVGGTEARRFGVATSGTLMLFLPDGTRLFAGGVTASRGHEGDNAGTDRLLAALVDHTIQQPTRVFGCTLYLGKSAVPGAPTNREPLAVRGAAQ
jgi:hypothetical protein